MKYWDLTKELKEGKLRSAYLIYGDDEGFANNIVKEVRKLSKVSETDVFNFIRLDGLKADLNELTSAISTLPVMSDKKYVEIFRADFLTGSRNIKDANEKICLVKDLFANPPEDMVLMVYYSYNNELERNDNKIKQIESKANLNNAAIVKLPSMAKEVKKNNSIRNEIINNTVNEIFSERKLTAPKFVVPFLRDFFDSNVDVLENDLNKILNYVGDRQVERTDFEKLMTKSGNMHIFNLTSLIVSGKTKESIELYHELLPKMKNPIELLGILGNKIREAYNYKVAIASSSNTFEVMKKLNISSEWFANQRIEEYKNISFERLNKMFHYLIEGEVKLKSASSNPENDMELIIIMISSAK